MAQGFRRAARAFALAAIYFGIYKFAWWHSADQFFLPAGLRVAALLFAPYRLWPAIFAGDAAALLSLRLPMAEAQNASYTWAVLSSLLLCPAVAVAPIIARYLRPAIVAHDRLMPAVLAPCALWGVMCNQAANSLFGFPEPADLAAHIYRFAVGQYLATLIVTLPAMLWLRRNERYAHKRTLLCHGLVGVGALLAIYLGASFADQDWMRVSLLGCMIAPVLVLTALHGWRGAAIAISASNIALGLSMPTTGVFGNHDTGVFVAQQAIAVISTFMLVVGSMMSAASEKASRASAAALAARALARAQQIQIEQALRERAEAIAIANNQFIADARETVQQLKAQGQYHLALLVNSQSLTNTRKLYEQAAALYPFRIERVGLYATLAETAFEASIGGASVALHLRGDLSRHTITMQIAAYRAICHAIEMVPADSYAIHARAWALRGERGISVRVQATSDLRSVGSAKSRAAEEELWAKMHAYGGASKRRHHSVFFVLGDGYHFFARGTTIHEGPLSPSMTLTVNASAS